MRIVINGAVPAQKNSKKMSTRSGRPVLYTEKHVKEWQESAHLQLKAGWKGTCEGRAGISYMFYVKDDRRRDWDNMVATVNDALVKADIITDDSWQATYCCGVECEIDRDNPRVELWIVDDSE